MRISVDGETGNLLVCKAGGLLTVKTVQVVPKYAKESRGWYGVLRSNDQGEATSTDDEAVELVHQAEISALQNVQTNGKERLSEKTQFEA
jgi:hypothetical protein